MTKTKKRQSERFSTHSFVLLFILSYTIAPLFALISPLLPILFIFLAQSILLKLQFGWSFRHWFLASILGLTLVHLAVWANLPPSNIFFQTSGSVVITAIFQYIVLRRYVNNAWLWMLAMMATSFVTPLVYNEIIDFAFTLLVWNIKYITLFTNTIMSLFQALILASTMLLIVRTSQSQHSSSLKNTQQFKLNMLTRLTDPEQSSQETKWYLSNETATYLTRED